jgi:hypothetical protein
MDAVAQIKNVIFPNGKLLHEVNPMPRNLEVRVDNGLSVTAPMEVWIMGIMSVLTYEQKAKMLNIVSKL